jgi:tripartite-type tricarboxylate transporter receptor subunit TctC
MPHLASIATPAAALFLALTAALPAGAEISAECRASFEGDRLSVIVPNGPGGGYDTYARAMAPVIAETTGARVSVENLPGAGGLIASRRIIEAQPDEWVILVVEAHDILYSIAEGELGPEADEKLRLMSVFHAEPSAWVVRPDFDALDPPDGQLVGGSSATNEDVGYRLISKAAGFASQTISGYDGTSAMSLGLLGSEIDVLSISLATAQRTTKAGDLAIAFVLSDGPYPGAPELPYLLGAGGALEPRLATMSEAERAEALRLAGIAVDIGFVLRTVVVPKTLPPDRMACLESVVNEVLFSDAFRNAAEAEGRAVNALSPEASQTALSELSQAMDAVREFNKAAP